MIRNRKLVGLVVFVLAVSCTAMVQAQEKKDPTAPSDVIKATLSKIRDVERLDAFVEQNNALVAENKQLKTDIAAIQKQLAKLTKDLADQTVKLRKQLLQMPTFQVQSKVISRDRSMAILKSRDAVLRIRTNTEMSVPVADGVWILMQVKNISRDMIELHFPELGRTVYLYN